MSRAIRLFAAQVACTQHIVPGNDVRVAFGEAGLDARLAGGLERAGVHEFFAARSDDASAVAGFAALLAVRARTTAGPLLWLGTARSKPLYAPGLAELGADPSCFTLVRAPDIKAMLRAAGEIVKCGAVSTLVIEGWDKPAAFDLTITRRLALASARSGVFTLLLRHGPDPPPSAARTRWRIASAPSTALAGNAPGAPAFDIELFRHRGGVPGFAARLEWNRDTGRFAAIAPLSGGLSAAARVGADQRRHARAA